MKNDELYIKLLESFSEYEEKCWQLTENLIININKKYSTYTSKNKFKITQKFCFVR